ncbi:MAG: hypothetical protein HDT43_03810 [Ruminococcaceae bacterium]|nr:hypothetical protein [Oscillospiraceae bacterium]
MKLSKQERIGAIIIIVILILALGGWLLVKPKIETISATKASLAAKQAEYNADVAKQARKAPLREEIEKAYEEGEHLADMFFPEMSAYEADMAFRAFLEQCTAKVVVEALTVSDPTVAMLGTNFYIRPEVEYDLKTYATQGSDEVDEEYAKVLLRQTVLAEALGDPQTIGANEVTFTVSAIDQDELVNFAEAVNNYKLTENGTETRKAVAINGLTLVYPLVTNKYEKLVEELNAEMETEGRAALTTATGMPTEILNNGNAAAANPDGTAAAATPGNNTEEQEIAEIVDYLYSYTDTFTFYCIERMQDPKSQLDAQDGVTA